MNNRPIGIFDSGLGGLTVLKELKKSLPFEDFVYLGDTARVPYGTRSKETIVKFAFQDANFLLKKKVKCIVVACNTACGNAFDELSEQIDIPIFGVIDPGAKLALKYTKNKRIGVIGTKGTILSHAYKKAIESKRKDIKVFEEEMPLFVPFIEEGEIKGELLGALVKKSLNVFQKREIDTLIMGCTHYPIIEKEIGKNLKNVRLVNPGVELASLLKQYLHENNMEINRTNPGKTSFYLTDLNKRFVEVAQMFLGDNIEGKVSKVDIEN